MTMKIPHIRLIGHRLILAALLAAFVFAGGCSTALDSALSPTLPKMSGEAPMKGLKSGAVIMRDDLGIPFIEADNISDLAFAVGYSHAQDRLAQMVSMSLVAQGRLAEMAGKDALAMDLYMRTLNLKKCAKGLSQGVPEELSPAIQAYADGVNAYMEKHKKSLPFDFLVTGYKPEKWKPMDSYYVFALLNLGLAVNLSQETAFLNAARKVGLEKAAWLAPIYPDEPIPFKEAQKLKDLDPESLKQAVCDAEKARQSVLSLTSLGMAASNNWALAPEKTAKGSSIVCNDTHLLLTLPSTWSIMHMRCPEYDAAGVAVPGLPGVVAGYNGHLAWGMTMVMADNQDVFVEKLKNINGKLHYLYKGEWRQAVERVEEFKVINGESMTRVVHETCHGPLINEALSGESKHVLMPHKIKTPYGLALSWAAFEPDACIEGFLTLGQAKTMDQARECIKKIEGISLNMIYGDKDNIAWQVTGRYPLRKKGRGLFPSPGWTGEYDWDGWLDVDKFPYSLNPESGFLATANARTCGRDYPYTLSSSWFCPERFERLNEVLGAEKSHTAEKSFALQYDRMSRYVPKVQKVLFDGPLASQLKAEIEKLSPKRQKRANKALEMLKRFDGDMDEDSAEAAVMGAFFSFHTKNVFSDEFGPVESSMWKSFSALGDMSYSAQEDHLVVRGDESPFWDDVNTPEKETKAAMIARSLNDAVDYLEQEMGANPKKWKWGKIHTYMFKTETSKMAEHMSFGLKAGARAIGPYLDRGPFPAGGDHTTLNAAGYHPGKDFDVWFVPEMRMVVDFSRNEPMYLMNSTGQSGNPASPHYDDGIYVWLDGDYPVFPFSDSGIKEKYTKVLKLTPEQ